MQVTQFQIYISAPLLSGLQEVYSHQARELISKVRVLLDLKWQVAMVNSVGSILTAQQKMASFHSAALHIDPSLPERCDEIEWRAQFRQFCLTLEKLKATDLSSIQLLGLLVSTGSELYKGCEAVTDILIQATLSISVESVVESWISVLEHHSSKSRNLGHGAIDAEMMVAINGPAVAHCQGVVKEAMASYWRQCKNVNLHYGHFVRKGSGALNLYKVSKSVDALNSQPEKCKFML